MSSSMDTSGTPRISRNRMTRQVAMIEARRVFGEMGTISAFEEPGFPCMVWEIGNMESTIGRGHTWESAFRNSEWRRAKFAKKGRK